MSGSSESPTFPREGRLMGLDYGTHRIGVAVSNAEQTIASPLENYTRRNRDEDALRLGELARDYSIVGIVVGLPVHMSGEEGQKARESRRFGKWIGEFTGLPVTYWDERYTSAIAEAHLLLAELTKKKRQRRMDKLAAQSMLQSFLDAADREQLPKPLR